MSVRLRTARLLLRQWATTDRAPFAALNADPEVMRYFPSKLTSDQSDAMADRCAARLEEDGWGLWALEVVETGAFIGFTGLAVPRFEAHFTPATEVGWRLAREAWHQGYATEAAEEAVAFAFEELKLPEIVSFTAQDNRPSRAVMERLGMTHDPAEDFDHPSVATDSNLRSHVLYRLPSPLQPL